MNTHGLALKIKEEEGSKRKFMKGRKEEKRKGRTEEGKKKKEQREPNMTERLANETNNLTRAISHLSLVGIFSFFLSLFPFFSFSFALHSPCSWAVHLVAVMLHGVCTRAHAPGAVLPAGAVELDLHLGQLLRLGMRQQRARGDKHQERGGQCEKHRSRHVRC